MNLIFCSQTTTMFVFSHCWQLNKRWTILYRKPCYILYTTSGIHTYIHSVGVPLHKLKENTLLLVLTVQRGQIFRTHSHQCNDDMAFLLIYKRRRESLFITFFRISPQELGECLFWKHFNKFTSPRLYKLIEGMISSILMPIYEESKLFFTLHKILNLIS
jgi:hypothetical protein